MSSPVIGSSSRSSGASRASAWAMSTRCLWPAESSPICLSARSVTSSLRAARATAARSAGENRCGSSVGRNRPMRTTSPTVNGSRRCEGCWLTRATVAGSPATLPAVGARSPARTSSRVVLPEPLGPTSATDVAARISVLTDTRACRPPRDTDTASRVIPDMSDMMRTILANRGTRDNPETPGRGRCGSKCLPTGPLRGFRPSPWRLPGAPRSGRRRRSRAPARVASPALSPGA